MCNTLPALPAQGRCSARRPSAASKLSSSASRTCASSNRCCSAGSTRRRTRTTCKRCKAEGAGSWGTCEPSSRRFSSLSHMLSGRKQGNRGHLVPQQHLAAWLESGLRANHWVSPSARLGEGAQFPCRHLVIMAVPVWEQPGPAGISDRLNVQLAAPWGSRRGGGCRNVCPASLLAVLGHWEWPQSQRNDAPWRVTGTHSVP